MTRCVGGATLLIAAIGAVGCGGGGGNVSQLNQTDNRAVAQAFSHLHNDVAKVRAAKALGKTVSRNFRGVPGGAPPVPVGQAQQHVRTDVRQISDALRDEAPDTTIPSQAGTTVSAFLSEVANTVQAVDPAAATELDRTREALTTGAAGGPSATTSTAHTTRTTTTNQQPDVLAAEEENLKSAGYSVRREGKAPIGPTSISGLRVTGRGVSNKAPVIIFAYGSPADAQAAAKAYQAHTPQGGATQVVGGTKVYFSADAGSLSAVRDAAE